MMRFAEMSAGGKCGFCRPAKPPPALLRLPRKASAALLLKMNIINFSLSFQSRFFRLLFQ